MSVFLNVNVQNVKPQNVYVTQPKPSLCKRQTSQKVNVIKRQMLQNITSQNKTVTKQLETSGQSDRTAVHPTHGSVCHVP
jgi:hypothetical protein